MSVCRVCNASVTWAQFESGDPIPLDDHEQMDTGPGRVRIVVDGTRPTVASVPEDSPIRTYVDHRVICQQPRAI